MTVKQLLAEYAKGKKNLGGADLLRADLKGVSLSRAESVRYKVIRPSSFKDELYEDQFFIR